MLKLAAQAAESARGFVRKAVLITGAGARIGAYLAHGLAKDGWHICIHFHESSIEAQSLADDIIEAGGSASIVQANLTVPKDVNTLVERCGRPLSALINNASTFGPDTAQTFTTETWDYHRSVNLDAPIRLSSDFAAQAEAVAALST